MAAEEPWTVDALHFFLDEDCLGGVIIAAIGGAGVAASAAARSSALHAAQTACSSPHVSGGGAVTGATRVATRTCTRDT